MKKGLLMLILLMIFFASGCGNEDMKELQISSTVEDEYMKDGGNFAIENIKQENNSTEKNSFLSYDLSKLDNYMASVEEQSNIISDILEHDESLTQLDMNNKSYELYELWDDALNYLWGELKSYLPEEEFAKLQIEQRIWIKDKEKAVEEAGKVVEGGSIYPLIVSGEATRITKERVYELYTLFKK